jgi:hypothetical protein
MLVRLSVSMTWRLAGNIVSNGRSTNAAMTMVTTLILRYIKMKTARKYTNQLLEMVDEGIIPARTALLSALGYMSESDVEDMMRNDEYLVEEEEE